MNLSGLHLPQRQEKPRQHGLTVLIDNGIPLQHFKDTICSNSPYIDFVKFGWGTSVISCQLDQKITCLKEQHIDYFFGGTLFEKFLSQGKISKYIEYCKRYDCKYVEISNGTIDITNKEKTVFIEEFAREFIVFSEVGRKDSDLNGENPLNWVDWIKEDIAAGAHKVITEARESGTSGVCQTNGDLRIDLIDGIISSNLDLQSIIFEAPNKKLQTAFVKLVGTNVNLANIPFTDCLSLETLRLGLRSDTFHIMEEEVYHAGYE
ncbi:phosphosulfolactate synthase [Metabacillus malikii]|uniref:Phosphosulfolactate synthase n=1 Tax=Metabacillus malikii TaxID=1504265 RepID=A0ABT9ZBD7_9BACI|nr:phosphosulfolactate synthase [Metabacillus malikii]MDQ0229568.1 phosphosulfolactate synthase [Metabacillus malikii]